MKPTQQDNHAYGIKIKANKDNDKHPKHKINNKRLELRSSWWNLFNYNKNVSYANRGIPNQLLQSQNIKLFSTNTK